MPPRVLLADASLTMHRVVELTLAAEGMEVAAVATRSEALARLRASPPDVVLADVGRPEPDGCGLAAAMKRDPRLAHIPIVLLRSAPDPLDVSRAAAPHDAVLSKPFDPGTLIDTVRRVIERRGAAAVQADTPAAEPSEAFEETAAWAAADVMPAGNPTDPLDAYFDRLDAAFADLRSRGALRGTGAAGRADGLPATEDDSVAVCAPDPDMRAGSGREPSAATALPDEVLDQIAERVISRMGTDRMRRLVLDTAERLVQEEIRKIKSMCNP